MRLAQELRDLVRGGDGPDGVFELLGLAPQGAAGLARELLPVVGGGVREVDAVVGLRRPVVERGRPPPPPGHLSDRLPQRRADLQVLEDDAVGPAVGQDPGERLHERDARRHVGRAEHLAADRAVPRQADRPAGPRQRPDGDAAPAEHGHAADRRPAAFPRRQVDQAPVVVLVARQDQLRVDIDAPGRRAVQAPSPPGRVAAGRAELVGGGLADRTGRTAGAHKDSERRGAGGFGCCIAPSDPGERPQCLTR